MRVLVWFFKFFAVITTILLTSLIIYTSFSYITQKEVTKEKIKKYLFNVSYTDNEINDMINTYEIKDNLGSVDYLTENKLDYYLTYSDFKDDTADYLSDIIYENKKTSDRDKIENILNKNIFSKDKNNVINIETRTKLIDTVNNYVNDLIKNNISKSKKTTVLLNFINYFLNVNIKLMLCYILGLCIILIIFTISLIRPIKHIAIASIISGSILASTKFIKGIIISMFIQGETNLLDASNTLVQDLFASTYKMGLYILGVGVGLLIIYLLLHHVLDEDVKEKKLNKRVKKNRKKKAKI